MRHGFSDKLDHNHFQSPHHLFKGVLFLLVFWLLVTLIAALVRDLQTELSIPNILFFQNAISLVLILPFAWKAIANVEFTKLPIGLLFVRCLCGQANSVFLFASLAALSLADAMVLNNTSPIFIPLLAAVWLKSKIPLKLWFGIVVGFLGVLLILKPSSDIQNEGAIFGILAGITFAASAIALRRLFSIPGLVMLVVYFAFGTLVFSAATAMNFTMPSSEIALKVLATGVITPCAHIMLIFAFRYASPNQLGPFNYSAVVYSALFDWLVWRQIPDYFSLVGMLLIAIGGAFTMFNYRPTPKQ